MKTRLSLLLAFALLGSTKSFAAQSVPVSIEDAGKSYQGDLYLPKSAKGPIPLVLVIHEWWGKTEHPRSRAERIANELGYAALAVDLFGDARTVDTPAEAQKLATPFYQAPQQAVTLLRKYVAAAPAVAEKSSVKLDVSRTAAIGFCFGGSQALNLARAGELPGDARLRSVVSFHGGLASSLQVQGPIEAKILVLHGEADPMVKPEEVAAFKKEMKAASADLTFKSSPGADHAFTNPKATEIGKKHKIPIAYDKKADQQSWKAMKEFLDRTLSEKSG